MAFVLTGRAGSITLTSDQDTFGYTLRLTGTTSDFQTHDILWTMTRITLGDFQTAPFKTDWVGNSFTVLVDIGQWGEDILEAMANCRSITGTVSTDLYARNTGTGDIGVVASCVADLTVSLAGSFSVTDDDGTVTEVDLRPVLGDWLYYKSVDSILPAVPGDILVSGYSRAAIYPSAQDIIETQYGAEIAQVTVRCENKTYTSDDQQILTDILTGSGDVPVEITVTDTRGYSASASGTMYVYPYAPPVITDVDIYRSNEDGTANEEGTWLNVFANVNHSDVGGYNACPLAVTWGVRGGDGTDEVIPGGENARVGNGTILPNNSYTVTFTAVDTVGNTASITRVVPTMEVTFDALSGGGGFAFGRMAERAGVVDTPWDISTDGSVCAGAEKLAEGGYSHKACMGADGTITGKVINGDAFGPIASTGDISGQNISAAGTVSGAAANITGAVTAGSGSFGGVSASEVNVSGAAEVGGVLNASGGIAGVTNYSTVGTEELTGGTWIDGKPIYRQVVTVTLKKAATTYSVDVSAEIDNVVNISGVFTTSDSQAACLNYWISSTYYAWAVYKPGGYIDVRSGGKGGVMNIIIEYTKV